MQISSSLLWYIFLRVETSHLLEYFLKLFVSLYVATKHVSSIHRCQPDGQIFPVEVPHWMFVGVPSLSTTTSWHCIWKLRFGTRFIKDGQILQVSLGQGQGPKAEKLLTQGMERGMWVCLQNCHLSQSWMPALDRIVDNIDPEKVTLTIANLQVYVRLYLEQDVIWNGYIWHPLLL